MPIYKKWVLAADKKRLREPGWPDQEDFQEVEDHTQELEKGEILCRALFCSIDPILRLYMAHAMEPGDVVPGRQVARVIDTRHKDFPKGKLIVGSMGWQTYSVLQPDDTQDMCGRQVPLVSDLPRQLDSSSLALPKSASLGVLGLPGLTAYFALVELCKPKPGETLLLSSAAGQTGHIIGQIAKILGLNVIGFTGDSDKASWIKMDLGLDWAFNYKTQELSQTVKIAAPHGVDIFIDSVGGTFHNTILNHHMKFGGRVVVLGNLSLYNDALSQQPDHLPATDLAIALKGLSIYGFNVFRFLERFDAALGQLADWCREGKLRPCEQIIEGFEAMPQAFIQQLQGKFQGKVIVRV